MHSSTATFIAVLLLGICSQAHAITQPQPVITNPGDVVDMRSVGNMLRASGTPLITVTPYVANGTVGNVIEFTNMVRVPGGGGILQTALVNDDAGQNAQLELWLFNQTFTPTADTIQFVISEADMDNRIAVIDFAAGTYKDGGTVSGATRGGLGIAYTLTGTSMFGVFVTRGTPDYVATDDLTAILVTIPD